MLSTNVALASSSNCRVSIISQEARHCPNKMVKARLLSLEEYLARLPSNASGKKLKKDRRTINKTIDNLDETNFTNYILRITNFTQRIRTFGARGIMSGSPFKESEMDLRRVYVLFRHHGKTAYSHLSSCARFPPDFTKSISAYWVCCWRAGLAGGSEPCLG